MPRFRHSAAIRMTFKTLATLPPEITPQPSVAFGTRGRETFRLPAAPSVAIGVALRIRRLVPKDPWFRRPRLSRGCLRRHRLREG